MTDYNALKQAVAEKLGALGVTFTATFVPQPASRNSDSKEPTLNWRVGFTRLGHGMTIATDFTQGIAHVPGYQQPHRGLSIDDARYRQAQNEAAVTGKYPIRKSILFPKADLPTPDMADVFQSLLLDASSAEGTFTDFCQDLGYDEDSRTAERIYLACRDTALSLARMFTPAELAELRTLTEDL